VTRPPPGVPGPTDPLLSAPPRPDWAALPAGVRAAVDRRLGSPVVRALTARGGFSPAVAARLLTADGDRVFAKVVPAAGHTAPLHRREAEVTASLPVAAPTPRLLWTDEVDAHVVVVLSDVAGSMPRHPWSGGDLATAVRTLDRLVEVLTPSPFDGARPAEQDLAGDFRSWARLAGDPSARAALEPWTARNTDRLVAVCAAPAPAGIAGDTLVHLDVRADNLLLTQGSPTGAVVVDWPWAARGAAWLDRVVLAIDVGVGGGDPGRALASSAVGRDADPGAVTAFLAAVAGTWAEQVATAAPPGMPTLRAFQRAELDVSLHWLRSRTRWA